MAKESSRPSKLTVEALRVGALFLLTGLVGVVYGARTWLPPVASRHGVGIDAMLTSLLVSVGVLFLAGHIVLGVLVWRAARQQRVTTRKTERVLSAALGSWR